MRCVPLMPLLGALLCLSAPLVAAPQEAAPDKPLSERTVDAQDVVGTPASDLNLRKDQVPPLLLAAQRDPYALGEIRRCSQIAAAVGELEAVLGPDLDQPQQARNDVSAGSVAQAAVGAFIPFRGLIREMSGANAQQRKLQDAIQAGTARRAFLKGYGQARGCRYPARAMDLPQVAAQTATPVVERPRRRAIRRTTFVSQPVVQKLD